MIQTSKQILRGASLQEVSTLLMQNKKCR